MDESSEDSRGGQGDAFSDFGRFVRGDGFPSVLEGSLFDRGGLCTGSASWGFAVAVVVVVGSVAALCWWLSFRSRPTATATGEAPSVEPSEPTFAVTVQYLWLWSRQRRCCCVAVVVTWIVTGRNSVQIVFLWLLLWLDAVQVMRRVRPFTGLA